MIQKPDRQALLIILIFTLVFFRSVLLHPGGMIYSPLSDLVGQTYGWKQLIHNTLFDSASLPFWNPHLICGNPILGNLNYALLFPLHLLYLLLPTGPAASLSYLLTSLLGALGAYFFLRVIGVRSWGALLGGLAYGFSVRNLGHLVNGFVGHLETLPLLPLCFAFATLLARRGKWRHAAGLSLSLGLVLLSAFAQIFVYLMMILPLYYCWLLVSGEPHRGVPGSNSSVSATRKPAVFALIQFSVASLLAAGLAAVHLLPSLDLLPELSRSGELAPALYRLGSLPLKHFFTLLNPELFGRPVP